jgi:hypothetical protein
MLGHAGSALDGTRRAAHNPRVRERWCTNCNQWVVGQTPKARGLGLGGVVLIAAFVVAAVTALKQGDESRVSVLAIGGAVAVGVLFLLREIAAATGTRCPICHSKRSLRRP